MKRIYTTPAGTVSNFYLDMLNQHHVLIAGESGSGKSVVINGMIYTALYNSPVKSEFILIDPKMVELVDYKNMPHTLKYACEPEDMIEALNYALAITKKRFLYMQSKGIKEFPGSDIYVIIDELADLMTTCRKAVEPTIQRLGQIGRAAHVHLVMATQCPLSCVIPTTIKVNMSAKLGLRTASKQDSRNILDTTGCELFPDPKAAGKAFGLYKRGANLTKVQIPKVPETEIRRVINHWNTNAVRFA